MHTNIRPSRIGALAVCLIALMLLVGVFGGRSSYPAPIHPPHPPDLVVFELRRGSLARIDDDLLVSATSGHRLGELNDLLASHHASALRYRDAPMSPLFGETFEVRLPESDIDPLLSRMRDIPYIVTAYRADSLLPVSE
jgi:hypothetical protein